MSFLMSAYENLGILILRSGLRTLPWGLLLAWITLSSQTAIGPGAFYSVALVLLFASLLLQPWLTIGVFQLGGRIAISGSAPWRVGLGLPKGPLFRVALWELVQALLTVLVIFNFVHFLSGGGANRFLEGLATTMGLWIWILARGINIYLLPILVSRQSSFRESFRLAALIVIESPARTLLFLTQRGLLFLALAATGLGVFLGLGSLPALQAAVATRDALRARGLDLLAPGEEALPADPGADEVSWRRIWRPWT